jgi:hypothetical protein
VPDSKRKTPPTAADAVPDEIRRNFVAVAAATDTPAPGDGSKLPAVNISQQILPLARTVGWILHAAPIFRFGESLVTMDETGRIATMTAERFTTFVESYLSFTRPGNDAPRVESIGKDMAGKILAADQFRVQLRELKGVAEVRLPVWTGEGDARTIELAPEGFHEATGIYTVPRVIYQEDMPPADGVKALFDVLREFPFDSEGEVKVGKRRSFAGQVAAMLGVYCRGMFEEGTRMPMVVYSANQPGSGKSMLMRMALAPVYGPPAEAGKPQAEKDFLRVLDSAALNRQPYLVLDDCKNIASESLNRFVTSPIWSCPLLYEKRNGVMPNITQTFITGNHLKFTPDLARRSLIIDLFEPKEAMDRTFSREITTAWLFSNDTRARLLAAMWSLVRAWRDEGMPMKPECRLGSFEEWCGTIGSIVTAFGMANPFGQRQVESGGDESGRALVLVIGSLVAEASPEIPPILTTDEILSRAEAMDMLETIVGFAKEPKKSLGHCLKKLRGRQLADGKGRRFEFGRREMAAGAKYPITFL